MKEKVISLKFYHSMVDAELDASILKENNVECKLNEGTMVGIYPLFDDKERGIEILVFEKDLERATNIIENYHRETDNL